MSFDFDPGVAEWLDGHFAGEALRRAVFGSVDMGFGGDVTVSVADDLMCVFTVPGVGLADGSVAVFLRPDDILVVRCMEGHVLSHVFSPAAEKSSGGEVNGVERWTVPWSEDAFLGLVLPAVGRMPQSNPLTEQAGPA